MNTKNKLLVSLSSYLKEKIESLSDKYGCSQAKIVKRISVVIKSSRDASLRTILIVLEFLLLILKQYLMNILI